MVPTGEADYVLVLHPTPVENNLYHKKAGGHFFSVFDLKDGLVQLSDLDNDPSDPVTERNCNIALLGMLSYKLGRSIEWDGRTEECVGDAQASRLLSRTYRKGWEYPHSRV